MACGTIKRIGTDRGFGFITPDGYGPDLFFHATSVVGTTFEQLRPGQRVEFDQSRDPWSGRQRAVNVRLRERSKLATRPGRRLNDQAGAAQDLPHAGPQPPQETPHEHE